jgi:hypothetical protein
VSAFHVIGSLFARWAVTSPRAASAGQVTLVVENPSSVPHDVSIEGGRESETLGEAAGRPCVPSSGPGEYGCYLLGAGPPGRAGWRAR